MNYLHFNSIVHRDLKLENILIANDNLIKISDFGTSKEFDSKEEMTFVGTYTYMAPELIKTKEGLICNEKVDIWSFGCVLWSLFTCERPFKNVNRHRILFGVTYNYVKLPIVSQLPIEIRLLIENCWMTLPLNRPTFQQILLYLQIFCKQTMAKITIEQLNELKSAWRLEIEKTYKFIEKLTCLTNDCDLNDSLIIRHREEIEITNSLLKMYKENDQDVEELLNITKKAIARLDEREIELMKKSKVKK